MALEAAGLVIGVAGLAGLFNSCLEAADRVQSYLEFDSDANILDRRFGATKARFELWGQRAGIGSGGAVTETGSKESSDGGVHTHRHHPALNNPGIAAEVEALLHTIEAICDGSTDSSAKRGGGTSGSAAESLKRRATGTVGSSDSTAAPSRQGATGSESRRHKLTWALWGKKQRTGRVENLEKLVDLLHNLVPPNDVQSTHGNPSQDPGT